MKESQRGISLIETLAAIAIIAGAGVAFLTALNGLSRDSGVYERHVTAAALAQSQVEELKAVPYASTYSVAASLQPLPSDYGMTVSSVYVTINPDGSISTSLTDTGRQQVTVAVSAGGKPVLKLTAIKSNGG